MVILPSTNTRDASKGIQMHFLETQLILWHHGNNIHVEKYTYVLFKSNNDKNIDMKFLSH